MAKVWHFCHCLVLNTLLRQRSLWDAEQKKGWINWKCCSGLMAENLSPFVSHQVLRHDIYIPTRGSVTVMTRLHLNMLLWKHNQSQEDEEERESCCSWYPGDHWWSEMKQSTMQKDHLEKELCRLCYHLFMSEIFRILGALLEYRCQRNFRRNSESCFILKPSWTPSSSNKVECELMFFMPICQCKDISIFHKDCAGILLDMHWTWVCCLAL